MLNLADGKYQRNTKCGYDVDAVQHEIEVYEYVLIDRSCTCHKEGERVISAKSDST